MIGEKEKQVLQELMQLGYDRNFIQSMKMECTEEIMNPLDRLSVTLVDTSWDTFEKSKETYKLSTKRWSAMRFSFTLGMGVTWFWHHRREEVEQKGFFACMEQPRGYRYMDEYIEDVIGIWYNKASIEHEILHYFINDCYEIINRHYNLADKQQEYAAAHVMMILGARCQATRAMREMAIEPYKGEMPWHWEVWNALYGVEDMNDLGAYNQCAIDTFQSGALGGFSYATKDDGASDYSKNSIAYRSVIHRPDAGMKVLFSCPQGKNELLTAFPILEPTWHHPLVIEKVHVWANGAEATITAHFLHDEERRVTFYDTDYLKNKDQYYVGSIYIFELYGIAYHAHIVPKDQRSFSLENEKAVNFNNQIGADTKYDEDGHPEPVVISLAKMHSFFQENDKLPEDVSFQSPIVDVIHLDYLGRDIMEVGIELSSIDSEEDKAIHLSIFVNPDQIDDPEQELKAGEPFRGVAYLQGRMLGRADFDECPSTLLHTFDAKDKDGAPTLFHHKCDSSEVGTPMTPEERQQFARDVYFTQMSGKISIYSEDKRKEGDPDFQIERKREVWVRADPDYDAQALFIAEDKLNYLVRAHMKRRFPVIAYISLYDENGQACTWTKGATYTAKIHYGSVFPGQKMEISIRYTHEELMYFLFASFDRLDSGIVAPFLHKDLDYRSNALYDPMITREEFIYRTERIILNNKKEKGGPVRPKLTYDEEDNTIIELHYPNEPSQKVTAQTEGGLITAITIEDLNS